MKLFFQQLHNIVSQDLEFQNFHIQLCIDCLNNLINITINRNQEDNRLINFNDKIKIGIKTIIITSELKKYIFQDFKNILGFTIIPFSLGNRVEDVISTTHFINYKEANSNGDFNHIYIKLNAISKGHTTMIFIIGY